MFVEARGLDPAAPAGSMFVEARGLDPPAPAALYCFGRNIPKGGPQAPSGPLPNLAAVFAPAALRPTKSLTTNPRRISD